MDNLTFKEKMMYNIFLKYAGFGMENGKLIEINGKSSMLLSTAIKFISKNPKILRTIIIEGFLDTTHHDKYRILEEFDAVIDDKNREEYEKTKGKIIKEYLRTNIKDSMSFFKAYLNEDTSIYEDVLVEKINNGEIEKSTLDTLLENFLNDSLIKDKSTGKGFELLLATITQLNQTDNKDLASYVMDKFKNVVSSRIEEQETLSETEKSIVINAYNRCIGRAAKGNVSKTQFNSLLRSGLNFNKFGKVTSFARVGDYSLQNLSLEQINNINTKSVKQIVELAKQKYQLSMEEEMFDNDLFNKMYILFGKQRTIELIEGKYGNLTYADIAFMLDGVKVNNYQIPAQNSEPQYDKYQAALNNFLFASGSNDVSANIRKILSGEVSYLDIPFKRLISEWKIYHDLLGGNVSMDELLTQMRGIDIVLPPHEQEIIPTVKIAGLSNLEQIIKIHEQMQNRTESTIPKIKGDTGKYEYEMLDLKDIHQLDVGYLTRCCFTLGGASNDSLIDGCTSKTSRIFVVKKDGKLVAQSWVWRNGNTLCFDNIEGYGLSSANVSDIWDAYKRAADSLLGVSSQTENLTEKIELITIGEGYGKIPLKGEKLDVEKVPLPIGEGLYTDANEQRVVATSPDYKKPRLFPVQPCYKDERKKINVIDPQQVSKNETQKIDFHIDKINSWNDPNNYKQTNSMEELTYVAYGEDWYIAITTSGEVVKGCTGTDKRSEIEMKATLESIHEKIKTGELNYNINDVAMLKEMLESRESVEMEEGMKHGR